LRVWGLAYHSSMPRNVALGLFLVIGLVGIMMAGGAKSSDASQSAERKKLVARREKLLNELARLERDHRGGRLEEPRYAPRREELVAALELVYGALDDADPEPAGAS